MRAVRTVARRIRALESRTSDKPNSQWLQRMSDAELSRLLGCIDGWPESEPLPTKAEIRDARARAEELSKQMENPFAALGDRELTILAFSDVLPEDLAGDYE